MEDIFEHWHLPINWIICIQSACSRREKCMRYQVGIRVADRLTHHECVFPKALEKQECPHFHPIRKLRFARGFKRIYEEVKACNAPVMRRQVADYLGGGGTYYRYRNGVYLLTPAQQDFIQKLFQRYGYTEEVKFDDYVTKYDMNRT